MMMRFPVPFRGPDVVSASDHLTVHPLFQDGDERGRVMHPHLSDPALQFAALDRQTVQALRAGQAPLWNPDLYGGAPLLGDGQSRPFSPVTLLRALLPDAPGLAQDLGVAWLFAWLSIGVALLTRRVLDSGVWVTATACAAATTTPYLSVWLLHPHASTFVWLPWCLLALECSSLPLMAAATAGVCMGGHGTLAHIAGIGAVWWLLRSREWRPVVGAVAGFLLAAPAWMPVWEQVQRSTTRTARVEGTLEPTLLLDLVWPGWWGHPVTETWSGAGAWADGQAHPGLAAVLLGLIGLWRCAAPCTAHSGGPSGRDVPGHHRLCDRPSHPIAHGRLASLVAIGWCLLAAVGAQTCIRRWSRFACSASLLVLGTGTAARWHDQHTLPASEHTPH